MVTKLLLFYLFTNNFKIKVDIQLHFKTTAGQILLDTNRQMKTKKIPDAEAPGIIIKSLLSVDYFT